MFVPSTHSRRESESVANLRAKTQDFYSDKYELTQILLRISEEKFGE